MIEEVTALHRQSPTIRAILLDRDGTINVERADYVRTPEQLILLPHAKEALARIAELGLPVAVITNQSGIGRKVIEPAAVEAIHARLRVLAQDVGLEFQGFFVCPHHPDDRCGCRKPEPGLILQAAKVLGLLPEECILVGDSITDLLAARAAGCRAILVRTGRQGMELESLMERNGQNPAHVALLADLGEATDWIAAELATEDHGTHPLSRRTAM